MKKPQISRIASIFVVIMLLSGVLWLVVSPPNGSSVAVRTETGPTYVPDLTTTPAIIATSSDGNTTVYLIDGTPVVIGTTISTTPIPLPSQCGVSVSIPIGDEVITVVAPIYLPPIPGNTGAIATTALPPSQTPADPQPTATRRTPTPLPQPTYLPPSEEWVTYVSEARNIAFSYPANWYVSEPGPYLFNYDPWIIYKPSPTGPQRFKVNFYDYELPEGYVPNDFEELVTENYPSLGIQRDIILQATNYISPKTGNQVSLQFITMDPNADIYGIVAFVSDGRQLFQISGTSNISPYVDVFVHIVNTFQIGEK